MSTRGALREQSESNQRAIREHSESTQSIKIKVIQSEPKLLRLVVEEIYNEGGGTKYGTNK